MPKPLPLIVGYGGINPSGRLSFNHGYRRLVIDALDQATQDRTYQSLATLMGISDAADAANRAHMRKHTLIRKIEHWDTDAVTWQARLELAPSSGKDGGNRFISSKRQLPDPLPANWRVSDGPDGPNDNKVTVEVSGDATVMLPHMRTSKVTTAGQLPTGFDPGALYQSRSHPRGLQLTVFAASDALRSTGFSVEELKARVAPDQFAVYASSAMGQLDNEGYGGLLQNSMTGRRPTAKNIPLGLSEMPADFVNAYVLGSAGGCAGIVGACASYLYNLKQGMEDIRTGGKRIVLVGNAEAPIVPEVIEGYRTMGALAEDEALMALDSASTLDHSRACRPFSDNCGFTVAESSVFTVLMDDELAREMGARILGSVADVFVNADGYKKSIPGPGIGNYLTMGKAMGLARTMVGERALHTGTHVQAHGTGTPANRVTESHILDSLAKTFGLTNWPVAAIKSYVGHSMAPASGDQISAVLGTWHDGILPGITSIDHLADDVFSDNLNLPLEHLAMDPAEQQAALVNSKGFGGNNATGLLLAPSATLQMLHQRWGEKATVAYQHRAEQVAQAADDYDSSMLEKTMDSIYKFGEGVLEGHDLEVSSTEIKVPGFADPVSLEIPNPYL